MKHAVWIALALAACQAPEAQGVTETSAAHRNEETPEFEVETAMRVGYLEIVTPDVDATCGALEELHGVTFSEPVAEFGNARTAALEGGGKIGVRAPMHEAETPVVRPYLEVGDVAAAAEAAQAAGGEIAHPAMELPGHCTFAIYFQGGNQYGLWKDWADGRDG